MDKKQRDDIVALIKREVVPAIGCTEPMAVALCTAKATERLTEEMGADKVMAAIADGSMRIEA